MSKKGGKKNLRNLEKQKKKIIEDSAYSIYLFSRYYYYICAHVCIIAIEDHHLLHVLFIIILCVLNFSHTLLFSVRVFIVFTCRNLWSEE